MDAKKKHNCQLDILCFLLPLGLSATFLYTLVFSISANIACQQGLF
ncbi:hypothetical protein SPACI_033460 [Sporomusa acidovorans DSM 3132]|uniref:Uncharacterized protein n=1 Tax=Sporomusa acidovorans (strain ATCC 49682 / DSM 3132 / Mol) TaxID=1123286 RepID=A0ABZ3J4X4_SPOA4|nr:hypothetical protein SPACI_42720 [Sporomusa acidovorans DSM 3132]SDF00591.1 hypothetical protein SAMN04488499_102946 [Sporomusa acidovorans]